MDLRAEATEPAWAGSPRPASARLRHDVEALPLGSLVVVDEVQRVPALGSWVAVAGAFVAWGSGARKLGRVVPACSRADDLVISCTSTLDLLNVLETLPKRPPANRTASLATHRAGV